MNTLKSKDFQNFVLQNILNGDYHHSKTVAFIMDDIRELGFEDMKSFYKEFLAFQERSKDIYSGFSSRLKHYCPATLLIMIKSMAKQIIIHDLLNEFFVFMRMLNLDAVTEDNIQTITTRFSTGLLVMFNKMSAVAGFKSVSHNYNIDLVGPTLEAFSEILSKIQEIYLKKIN